jgi:hypothetical protein
LRIASEGSSSLDVDFFSKTGLLESSEARSEVFLSFAKVRPTLYEIMNVFICCGSMVIAWESD